jgi:hypothetical protein
MYACLSENGSGFFEGGVQVSESATYFSRPTPTAIRELTSAMASSMIER